MKIKIKNSELEPLFLHINYLLNNAKVDSVYVRPELIAIVNEQIEKAKEDNDLLGKLQFLVQQIFIRNATSSVSYPLGRNFDKIQPVFKELVANKEKINAIEDEEEKTKSLADLLNEEVEFEIYEISEAKVAEIDGVAYDLWRPLQKHGIIK